jgi:hypothetical protein
MLKNYKTLILGLIFGLSVIFLNTFGSLKEPQKFDIKYRHKTLQFQHKNPIKSHQKKQFDKYANFS